MAQNEDVYTISDRDVLDATALDLARSREADRKGAKARGRQAAYQHNPGGASPVTASSLSILVLGAGQAYNGQRQLGALLFLTEVLVAAAHWSAVKLWSSMVDLAALWDITEWGLVQGIAMIDLAVVGLVLVTIFQAYHHAETRQGGFEGFGNPLVSGVASFVLPGWGQIMNAQVGKAMFFLGVHLMGIYVGVMMVFTPFFQMFSQQYGDSAMVRQLSTGSIATMCACAILWMMSVYDAVLVSSYRRRGF